MWLLLPLPLPLVSLFWAGARLRAGRGWSVSEQFPKRDNARW